MVLFPVLLANDIGTFSVTSDGELHYGTIGNSVFSDGNTIIERLDMFLINPNGDTDNPFYYLDNTAYFSDDDTVPLTSPQIIASTNRYEGRMSNGAKVMIEPISDQLINTIVNYYNKYDRLPEKIEWHGNDGRIIPGGIFTTPNVINTIGTLIPK